MLTPTSHLSSFSPTAVAIDAAPHKAVAATMKLSRAAMLRSFLRSDPTAEGLFFAGVKTTGIFCRPTCRARKPRPENVEFFPTAAEAAAKGYRACKLCHPTEPAPPPPALIERLRRVLERSPRQRLGDKELQAMNIEPSTARRQFRRYYGMTFQAYQRGLNLGLALGDLHRGTRVIDAQVERGFESASGFRSAFAKTFGASPGAAQDTASLLSRLTETPLGPMLLVAGDDGLHVVDFVDRRGLPRRLDTLQRKLRSIVLPGDNPHLEAASRQLAEYFAGQRLNLDLPLSLVGSPWERAVWQHLRTIPPAETKTYSELASELGRPGTQRAVGRANGANFLEIVLPCHRVIRSDGKLCGYGGGLWRKQWLLAHERKFAARSAAAPPAFSDRKA